jgi:hypothetical protein
LATTDGARPKQRDWVRLKVSSSSEKRSDRIAEIYPAPLIPAASGNSEPKSRWSLSFTVERRAQIDVYESMSEIIRLDDDVKGSRPGFPRHPRFWIGRGFADC